VGYGQSSLGKGPGLFLEGRDVVRMTRSSFGSGTQTAASPLAIPVETVIRPVKSRIRVSDVTRNLELVRVLVSRDLKIKYKQSLLGPIWLVFQPAAMLIGFVVGFSSVAHIKTEGVPYALFALTGLSLWSYFSSATTAGSMSLVGNTNLVRYTACPRLVLTLANLLASAPALIVPFTAALIAAVASGYLSLHLLLVPALAAWLFGLTAAVTTVLAAFAVKFRDVPAALPFILQAGVFFTPVAYPVSHLPSALQTLLNLNPLTGLLDAWRWCLLSTPVSSAPLIFSLVITGGSLIAAWTIFGRLEVTMTDDI
jgi:lipopolysaccharide transport system permease protein